MRPDCPWGQDQQQRLRQSAACEVDQCDVADELLGQGLVGVGGDLDDEQSGLGMVAAVGLDEPVGELARLDQLRRQRPPGIQVADAREPEDGVAVVLDQPFAAAVVGLGVHLGSPGSRIYGEDESTTR